jgi:hypothetical protein
MCLSRTEFKKFVITPRQISGVTSREKIIPGEDNTADEASRGLNPEQLADGSAKWLQGPDFLWNRTLPEICGKEPIVSSKDPEIRKSLAMNTKTAENRNDFTPIVDRLKRFSSWTSAKIAIATCLKYKDRLLAKSKEQDNRPMKAEAKEIQAIRVTDLQLQWAENEILKVTQSQAFGDEIGSLNGLAKRTNGDGGAKDPKHLKPVLKATSPLYKLDPFIDQEGILRVGGRIRKSELPFEIKDPAIIPKDSHITGLIIRYHHESTQHQGRNTTISHIRENGFWIVGCRRAVGSLISKCITCRKIRSDTVQQKMGDLPKDRLSTAPAFTFCGVDLFGPFHIKDGRKDLKRYGVVFTCLAMRAVHVETVNSMTTF